jgi:hypothetical protein
LRNSKAAAKRPTGPDCSFSVFRCQDKRVGYAGVREGVHQLVFRTASYLPTVAVLGDCLFHTCCVTAPVKS